MKNNPSSSLESCKNIQIGSLVSNMVQILNETENLTDPKVQNDIKDLKNRLSEQQITQDMSSEIFMQEVRKELQKFKDFGGAMEIQNAEVVEGMMEDMISENNYEYYNLDSKGNKRTIKDFFQSIKKNPENILKLYSKERSNSVFPIRMLLQSEYGKSLSKIPQTKKIFEFLLKDDPITWFSLVRSFLEYGVLNNVFKKNELSNTIADLKEIPEFSERAKGLEFIIKKKQEERSTSKNIRKIFKEISDVPSTSQKIFQKPISPLKSLSEEILMNLSEGFVEKGNKKYMSLRKNILLPIDRKLKYIRDKVFRIIDIPYETYLMNKGKNIPSQSRLD